MCKLTPKEVAAQYCKIEIFCENFIFANSIKRHICDVKNSRLGHDLLISVKDRVISPFRRFGISLLFKDVKDVNPSGHACTSICS